MGMGVRQMCCEWRTVLVCAFLIGSSWAGAAADPRVDVSIDRKTMRMGETATMKIELIGFQAGGSLRLPAISGLRHQQVGRGVNTVVDGAVATVRETHSFIIAPQRTGEIRIPPLTLTVEGKQINSAAVILNVVAPGTKLPEDEFARKEFFAVIEPARTNVYSGQPFRVDLKLYFTAGRNFQMPTLVSDGFTFSDLPHREEQQRYGGRIFRVLIIPKVALPVKAGKLRIGPAKFSFTRLIPTGGFGLFQNYRRENASTEATAVEVNVNPLPDEGRPAGFQGVVGSYKMDVLASPTNLTAGDPITLQISIAGSGALENVRLPSFDDWEGFKVYPPTDNINYTDQANRTGIRMFEQVVVPEKADTPHLPGFEFSFFDPAKGSYETIKNPPLPLTVSPAAKVNSAPVIMVTQTNQADVGADIATELVHIKPSIGTLSSIGATGAGALAVPAAMALMWGVLLLRRRNIERLENDPRLRRKLATDKLIAEEIVRLKELADGKHGADFFKLLVSLLQERLGERLDLPASAITEAVIQDRLKPAGVEEGLRQKIGHLFDACNQAHYAPDVPAGELQQLADDAETAMKKLEEVQV